MVVEPAHRVSMLLLLVALGSVVSSSLLHGQAPGAQNPSSDDDVFPIRFEARAGVAAYGTGNERFCNPGRAATLGVEGRTRGPWILSITADLPITWGLTCFDVLRTREFEGQTVGIWGRQEFVFDPRVAVHGGYEFSVPVFGGVLFEPTVGAGLQFTQMSFAGTAGGDSDDWRPWYGGTLTIRPAEFGLGVQVEAGKHQLLRRYCPAIIGDCLFNGGIIREFTIWRNFFRIGFTYRIN